MAEPLRAPLYSQARETLGEVELPATVFGAPLRGHLLYETVKMQLARRRAGTHATKTRAFVSGGGKKPWRQKGTGRARAGSTRSPLWVGGASVFGPQPRDYWYSLPQSARRQALCTALAARNREDRLLVVDRLEVPTGKTRDMVKTLAVLGVKRGLIVLAGRDQKVERAAHNIPGIKVVGVAGLNVYDVLLHEHLVLTSEALEKIKERLAA
jgi:large subunit ribosomal protein L4